MGTQFTCNWQKGWELMLWEVKLEAVVMQEMTYQKHLHTLCRPPPCHVIFIIHPYAMKTAV